MTCTEGVTERGEDWDVQDGEIELEAYDLNLNSVVTYLTVKDLEAMLAALRGIAAEAKAKKFILDLY